jgi:hypothetical protein
MKGHKYFRACFLMIVFWIQGCEEVFEQNLNTQSVTLLTPLNNQISSKSVVFSWDQKDGSASYEIQVVNPGFDSAYSIVLDTTIKQNFYLASIDTGAYQWRVRAFNSYSTTPFSNPGNFTIH